MVVVSPIITVVAAVAVVIVVYPAMIAIPITRIELLAIMVGFHPVRALICGTRPIAIMPPVMSAHRVIITADPHIAGTRTPWLNVNYARPRRRANSNSYRNLSEESSPGQQH